MHQNSDLKNPKLVTLFGVQEVSQYSHSALQHCFFFILGLNNIHLKYPHQTLEMSVQN